MLTISLSEDAYKKVINPASGDIFKDKGFHQVQIPEAVLYAKMKEYEIDNEDKKIRVIKPILENGRVVDISVLIKAQKHSLTWDRG